MDTQFQGTISTFSSNSIAYLRSYLKSPNLGASDVRYMIDYLENQRGHHERLCYQESGLTIPEIKGVWDVINFYDEKFQEMSLKDEACKASRSAERLSTSFSYEPISRIRGYFDAPTLEEADLLQVINYLEKQAGRFAALCEQRE